MSKREKLYNIIMICLAAGVSVRSYDEGDAVIFNQFDLAGFLIQIFGNLFLAYFCYVHRAALVRYLRYLRGPMPLAMLALLSSAWSIVPSYTFRRSIAFLILTFSAYYIGAVLNPEELYKLYVRAIGGMVVLSVLFIVFLPQYGISHGAHAGDWRGAFYHKNRAGEIMALAVITFGIVPPIHLSPKYRWSIAAISLPLLYKAHASTAVVAVAIIFGAQVLWKFLLLSRKTMLAVALAGYPFVAVVLGAIIANSSALLKLLGKDASLSGRDRLWSGVLDAISVRPLLGYGYLAFWVERAGKLIVIREKTAFVTVHAHNGFLNLMLHLGIVGLCLFLIFLISIFWLTIREGRRTHKVETQWLFSMLILIVIGNLTESQIVESPFFWTTLIAFYTSFSIERARSFNKSGSEQEERENLRQLVAA